MFLTDKNLMPTPVVVSGPFTLGSLIAFCASKAADETYCYSDNGHCLIGQYLKVVVGCAEPSVGGHYYRLHWSGDAVHFPGGWEGIAQGHPRTFGGALERARAYQAGAKS